MVRPLEYLDLLKVVGAWKLVSFEVETQATGQKEFVMGKNPTGYAVFTPEGRVRFVLTGEGRKPPKTVQDRADLLDSGCVHGDISYRRRQLDYQGRGRVEPCMGRCGAETPLQGGR